MIDREHIERVLKINGLAPTSPDEEIRSVLVSAKWHKDDVETALTVLRENVKTHQTRTDTLHNVFLTDERLSPEAIESLLGIDVEISSKDLKSLGHSRRRINVWQALTIGGYALVAAVAFMMLIMYWQQIGIFHPGV